MTTPPTLPIHEALPALAAALAGRSNAVLVAPPGAGKTTVVPLALLDQPWTAGGRILVLEPRRLAARAAARRMAVTLGEPLGQTVGLRVRGESRVSARTRVEVVTEGVFTRMILDDPGLEGVAAVLFDEFHERSLDADLGLAFALDAQAVLRPDLRLLVMSATLDGARVAGLLGPDSDPAPVVESQGRAFPVETRHLGRDPVARIEDQAARAVRQALAEEPGSLLVFLPGQAEIRRTEQALADRLPPDVILAPLYGALGPAEQDRAVEPAPAGRRKIVLATAIAETSLTIQGVRGVIDSGLSREPRFDPASGLTRLTTVRVSQAAADQRRGRAGRTEPGVCWRLWSEGETRALRPFARPEILDSDLSRLLLDLALWGARDAADLRFLDPPPAPAMAEARALLVRLGALDGEGTLTPHGRAVARLPLPPRLAHMVVRAAETAQAPLAARIAAVVTERGLGGDDPDLRTRLERLDRDGFPRAKEGRALAARWAQQAAARSPSPRPLGEGDHARQRMVEWADEAGQPAAAVTANAPAHFTTPSAWSPSPRGRGDERTAARLLALAYPERIAKARGAPGEYRLAAGRGAHLDPTHPLAREPWLAVGELGGGEARDRILLAAPLDPERIAEDFHDQLTTTETLDTDAGGRLRAQRITRLGRLEVAVQDVPADPALIRRALLDRVRAQGLGALPPSEALDRLRARVASLGLGSSPAEAGEGDRKAVEGAAASSKVWPDLSDAALTARLEDWLDPLLDRRTSLSQIPSTDLAEAVANLIPWDLRRDLDRLAPSHFQAPTGSRLPIDYAAEGGPEVTVRVQELFGLTAHPAVAGRPLRLVLTSPAHRPIQTTADLPGFWRGSWSAVRAEMRGRYPRHPWPEDPAAAPPTTRAKPRG